MLNLKRPAKAILIDLIYQRNKYSLDNDHVKFGLPEALDQRPDDLTDENTFIPASIDGRYDGRFDKVNGFLYRRKTFDEVGLASLHVDLVPPFTTHQLIDRINEEYGLMLTKKDLVNRTYTQTPASLTLVAAPQSYVWIGDIQLTIQNNYIPIYRLDGFKEWTLADPTTLYQGLSADRLMALINQTNGLSFVLGTDLSFGKPKASDLVGYNTRLTTTPLGSRVGGPTEDIYYNRLDLSVLDRLPAGVLTKPDTLLPPFTIHQLLPSINRALGLSLTPDEVVDVEYPHYTGAYDLIIDETNSLAWTGRYRFLLDKDLKSTDFTHYLNGFTIQQLIADPNLSLMDLMNQAGNQDGVVFSDTNIAFGLPTDSAESGYNTEIIVSALPNEGLVDSATFYFNRVDVSTFDSVALLESDNFYQTEDIIQQLNDLTGQQFSVSDFQPFAVPEMQYADETVITLQTAGSNQRYAGKMAVDLSVEVPIPIADDLHQLLHGVLPMSGPYF